MKHSDFFRPGWGLFVLFSFLFLSCQHPTTSGKKPLSEKRFLPGVVYDSVKCTRYPGETYALRLPQNYTPGKRFPVLFLFDAHARGWLPVKRYQSLSDTFGFILAASNNLKNGLSSPQRNRLIYHFMADVEKRFPLNALRIYTGGFSGGARVAAGIGLSNPGIAGTIGCAAGFPQVRQVSNKTLAWAGVVGNTDFNYLEMKQLSEALQKAGWHHCLLIFDGHHQWPPLATMKKAFGFLQTDAMRRGLIPKDPEAISRWKKTFQKEIKKYAAAGNLLKQWRVTQQAVNFLDGLTDIHTFQKDLKRLQHNHSLKKIRELQATLKKDELHWQQIYSEALKSRDATWWKTALAQLNQRKTTAAQPLQKQMEERLNNYLSLMAYLYASGSLNNRQPEMAAKYLMIYQTVDPGNPEVWFLKAEQAAMTGKKSQVLPLLQKAAEKGFHDTKRLLGNPYFSGFHHQKAFQQILLQVKNNPVKEE